MNRDEYNNFIMNRPARRDHSAAIIVAILTAIGIGLLVGIYWSRQ